MITVYRVQVHDDEIYTLYATTLKEVEEEIDQYFGNCGTVRLLVEYYVLLNTIPYLIDTTKEDSVSCSKCCKSAINSLGWNHDQDCPNWVLTY